VIGVKWQGHEANHSYPPNAEVRNGGAVPPLPMHLHSMVLNYLKKGTTIPFNVIHYMHDMKSDVNKRIAL
jgi:hypothetical protein